MLWVLQVKSYPINVYPFNYRKYHLSIYLIFPTYFRHIKCNDHSWFHTKDSTLWRNGAWGQRKRRNTHLQCHMHSKLDQSLRVSLTPHTCSWLLTTPWKGSKRGSGPSWIAFNGASIGKGILDVFPALWGCLQAPWRWAVPAPRILSPLLPSLSFNKQSDHTFTQKSHFPTSNTWSHGSGLIFLLWHWH